MVKYSRKTSIKVFTTKRCKMNFVKKNFKIIVIAAVLLCLLIVATFCDLAISEAFVDLEIGKYYSKNPFAVFFEIFGEMPVYIVPSIALGVIFFYLKKISKLPDGIRLGVMIFIVVVSIGFNYYGSHKLIKYFNIHIADVFKGITRTLLEGALAVIFAALWFFIASLLKKEHLKNGAICALIVIFTTLFSQVAVQLIKPLFGRARYRTMNALCDFKEFTRWYEINIGKSVSDEQLAFGIEKDGYKSFPSGHTAAAAVTFSLMAIPKVFNLSKKSDYIITAATCLLVAVVAFSRIVMGAHYLSDVTVGALITLVCYFLAELLVNKLLAKYSKKTE